jgi:hypothetical protein
MLSRKSVVFLASVACTVACNSENGSSGKDGGANGSDGAAGRDALTSEDARVGTDTGAGAMDAMMPAADSGVQARDASVESDSGTTGVWRPFAPDSPWNTPISPNPVIDPNSADLVERLATSSAQWPWLDIAIAQYSVPIYWADNTTPLSPVTVTRVAGEGFHDDPNVPIPAGAMPAGGTDRHLAIIHRVTGMEWDFWHAQLDNGTWRCDVCAAIDTAGSGVRPHPQQQLGNQWYLAHGSRACGFPLSAGLIMVEEIQAGRIEHALVIGYPGIRPSFFKPPASTAQAQFGSLDRNVGIPCGGRIQLDPSIDIETLGLSSSGKIIARALQEYGAYVGDYNGSISLYADSSPDAITAWSGGLLRTAEVRNQIALRSFRVLEIGQLFNDGN